ncbi:MAG: LysR family transcriptional regulator, partial [Lachnospiraceae bacterium]|nr:LysR family transcriptional regulator [Lachnospiraceae bacterium]
EEIFVDTLLLREFVAIVDYGSFENASYELFTTQSSLSKHIRKLETELQVLLFEKQGRNSRLTAAGKDFLPYARRMLLLEEETQIMLQKYQESKGGTVSIAAVPHLGAYHISEILTLFQQQYPDLQIQLSSTSKTTVQQMLTDHSADLAFLRYAPWDDISTFHVIPFADDELCVICPKDHPLAKQDSVRLGALKNEKFLGYRAQSFMHRLTTECCLDAGFNPNVIFVAQRLENVVELVSNKIGIALTMLKPVQYGFSDNTNIKIVRVEPPYKCRVDLCYLKTRKLSGPAMKLIGEVQNYLAQHPDL